MNQKRLWLIGMLLCCFPLMMGHLNSPHVFVETEAGPYPIAVVVHMPTAVPGEADVRVRLLDLAEDEQAEVRVQEIPPQGDDYAPQPSIAARSAVDHRFFNAPVPLMDYGVWQVKAIVEGARGSGEVRVPISARVAVPRGMERMLSTTLIILCVILFVTLFQMLLALGREAHLPPDENQQKRNVRGYLWAVVGCITFALTLGFTISTWRNFNDKNARKAGVAYLGSIQAATGTARSGVPSRFELSLEPKRGVLRSEWIEDGGQWMHLLLVHGDAASAMAHLHPTRRGNTQFTFAWAPPKPGTWKVFAQLLEQSGERVTVPLDLEITEGPESQNTFFLSEADSQVQSAKIGDLKIGDSEYVTKQNRVCRMLEPSNGVVPAGDFVRMKFVWEDESGNVIPLKQAYDGASSRVWIMKEDFSTFAALTPGGTLQTEALKFSDDGTIEIPYGFPSPGVYRIWVQGFVEGEVQTAVFDLVSR